MARLDCRFLLIFFDGNNFFSHKNFVKTYRSKDVQFIENQRTISRNMSPGLMACLESNFVTIKFDIKFFLQINILLRHVEEKMFSFLGSNERFQEIGQPASWLACKVDFFVDKVDINIFLLAIILLIDVEQRTKDVQNIEFLRSISRKRTAGPMARLESLFCDDKSRY